MASFSQGILHYGKFVANVIFPKMDLIGNQITKVPIHNHYKRICNQIPIKKVKDLDFFNPAIKSYRAMVKASMMFSYNCSVLIYRGPKIIRCGERGTKNSNRASQTSTCRVIEMECNIPWFAYPRHSICTLLSPTLSPRASIQTLGWIPPTVSKVEWLSQL